MTTSLIELCKGNFQQSLYEHLLCIPTILVGIACIFFYRKKDILYKVLWTWAILMIIYYVVRMILYFPGDPMAYNTNSLLGCILRLIKK